MARPLRIEYAGAVYHIMARGNGGDAVFRDDDDRAEFLSVLGAMCGEAGWRVLCYCLLDNHLHLVAATDRPTLSRGMRQLLGVYSQRFNRRHSRRGHLFQGRYKALPVETSAYLTQVCAYVLRNPVEAGLAKAAADWPWSSYRFNAGKGRVAWFDPAPLWDELGVRRGRAAGIAALAAKDAPAPEARGQLCYGGDDFAAALKAKAGRFSPEHPRATLAALSPEIAWYDERYPERAEAMARACRDGHHSRTAVARYYGVYPSTVSRAVKAFDAQSKT
ncbi:MAG: transposase [Alphaproteobacteria bacterium]